MQDVLAQLISLRELRASRSGYRSSMMWQTGNHCENSWQGHVSVLAEGQ